MAVTGGAAARESGPFKPRVAVVAALSAEARSLEVACRSNEQTGDALPTIVQSGPGPARAAAAAERALQSGASALVSWGLAGGLTKFAPPGTVVIPDCVVRDPDVSLDIDEFWRQNLIRKLGDGFALAGGRLLSVDRVLRSPPTKAASALASNAVAADMESGAIGAVAHAAGVPFVVIRVIVDGHDDQLPDSIEAWVTPTGQTRVAPLARVLLAPRELGMFTVLVRRSWVAQRALRQLARVLVPTNFCCARESDRERLS